MLTTQLHTVCTYSRVHFCTKYTIFAVTKDVLTIYYNTHSHIYLHRYLYIHTYTYKCISTYIEYIATHIPSCIDNIYILTHCTYISMHTYLIHTRIYCHTYMYTRIHINFGTTYTLIDTTHYNTTYTYMCSGKHQRGHTTLLRVHWSLHPLTNPLITRSTCI